MCDVADTRKKSADGRRGRPPANQPSVRVSTWLRVCEFNRLNSLAQRQRSSVSRTVRQLLVVRLAANEE